MQAVLDAIKRGDLHAHPALLISNNPGSQATQRATREKMPFKVLSGKTHPEFESLDEAILEALLEHEVDLIVLAGYMKKLGPKVLSHFENRILNIHPSLLPKFGGQGMYGAHVHRAVLEAGETMTGVTIHFVNEEYDEGRIIAQTEVPVLPRDTVETLGARVLVREHQFLVETLAKLISNKQNGM